MSTPYFLAIDIETTHTDPKKGLILEIAWQLLDRDLATLRKRTFVVRQYDDFWSHWHSSEVIPLIRDMHDKSGLLADLEKGEGESLGFIYTVLSADLASVPEGIEVHALGKAVGNFDLAWLDAHGILPSHDLLSHRVLDIRSIKTFFALRGEGLVEPEFEGTEHRAADDVEDAVRWIRANA